MVEDPVNISTLSNMKMMENCSSSCSNVKVGPPPSPPSQSDSCMLYVCLQVVSQVQFLCEGLGLPCIGLLGLLGNVAAIIVLRLVRGS